MSLIKKIAYIFFFTIPSILWSQAADFTISDLSGCTPHLVKFALDPATVNLDTINAAKWHFGYGDTLTSDNPDTVTYMRKGDYTITLVLESDGGRTIVQKPDIINVYQTQPAGFLIRHISYGENYECKPLEEIIDTSKAYRYSWRFKNLRTLDSTETSINLSSGDISDAVVTVNVQTQLNAIENDSILFGLRISDLEGCSSSHRASELISGGIEVANVFAVNSNNQSYFTIIPPQNRTLNTGGDYDVVLRFEVFTRKGILVYKEEAPTINWDGRSTSGQDLGSGVYFYVLKATSPDPNGIFSKQGFIHLFR